MDENQQNQTPYTQPSQPPTVNPGAVAPPPQPQQPMPQAPTQPKNKFKILFFTLTPILIVCALLVGVYLGRNQFTQEVNLVEEFTNEYGDDWVEDDNLVAINARDTERKTDINIIHAALEVYYADSGNYPPTDKLSSPTWVQLNMPTLSVEDLTDPLGGSYTYSAGLAGCDNGEAGSCSSYTLSADLEKDSRGSADIDGNTADYIKNSLN